ncbi:MAG TPA: hypothetical protein VK524_22835 [Polyangiaceae bacterium]|nr:hypothetical protein [Polyangiaceae bacterium]
MTRHAVDPDALFCALVLAPRTFSRNRFFNLYEDPVLRRVRGRAARVRGIVRQLTASGRLRGEIVGEQVLEDGRVLLRYRVHDLAYYRTTALSALEAAALRYALHRAGAGPLSEDDRAGVEEALQRFNERLELASSSGE